MVHTVLSVGCKITFFWLSLYTRLRQEVCPETSRFPDEKEKKQDALLWTQKIKLFSLELMALISAIMGPSQIIVPFLPPPLEAPSHLLIGLSWIEGGKTENYWRTGNPNPRTEALGSGWDWELYIQGTSRDSHCKKDTSAGHNKTTISSWVELVKSYFWLLSIKWRHVGAHQN